MKTRVVVLMAALLCAATLAAAQGRPDRPMAGKMGAGQGMPGLSLNDEQKSKMADLRLKHLKEVEPLKAELQKQHSALKLELAADKFNESKVKSIQSEISKLQNDLALKGILHRRAVRDLLTPEQQKQFDTRALTGEPGFMGRGPMAGGPHGPGMGMGQMKGRGMGAGKGMHRGMMMRHGGCPCCSADGGPSDAPAPTPEPKK